MKAFALYPLLATALLAEPVPMFIGTQTGGSGKSEGIYATTFDPADGSFGPLTLAAKYKQPGFLILHPEKPLLYCTGAPETAYPDKSSSLAAFRIEGPGKLSFLKDLSTGGNDACHLALDATGRTIAIANYGDGHISTVRLDGDGLPDSRATVIANTGKGPNKVRQEKPHAHGVYFDPQNQHLFVPDLGLDHLWSYAFDAKTSTLDPASATFFEATPGAGPRHVAFTADFRFAYIVNELENTVTACRKTGEKFEAIHSISTLPADWKGGNTTAEIDVHPNGKFVYASNRGHDSIAVFSRDEDSGRLSLVGITPCGGETPRHFKIAPGGKWLICAHQGDNTISALPLDPATGKLGTAAAPFSCPNPICILFAPAKN